MRIPVAAALMLLAATPAVAQRGPGGGRPPGGQSGQAGQPPPRGGPGEGAGGERATVMVEPVGMFIAACDGDGDGKVTRAELAACVERSFRAIDTAGAGRLGYIAFADWAERWLGDRSALPSPFAVDVDGDNQITLAELQAAIAHAYDRFDKNKDGAVTRAELLTIRDAPGGGERPDGKRGRGGRGKPPPGG